MSYYTNSEEHVFKAALRVIASDNERELLEIWNALEAGIFAPASVTEELEAVVSEARAIVDLVRSATLTNRSPQPTSQSCDPPWKAKADSEAAKRRLARSNQKT